MKRLIITAILKELFTKICTLFKYAWNSEEIVWAILYKNLEIFVKTKMI